MLTSRANRWVLLGRVAMCFQVNKATQGLLKRVEPYVAYGYPNLKTVKELIYKRGYAKVSEREHRKWNGPLNTVESVRMRQCSGCESAYQERARMLGKGMMGTPSALRLIIVKCLHP